MNDDIRVLFGRHLRNIRLTQRISQEDLAFRAGLHRTYVSAVERGERNVSIINIKKLAEALGKDIRSIMP